MRVGVLALPGAFAEHCRAFESLGCEPVELRLPSDLKEIDALVLPGGESTTVSKLLRSSGLDPIIGECLDSGMPAFGTCAGMILLASRVDGAIADQHCYGSIDIAVTRNAFGRQVHSFEADLNVACISGGPFHAVFIRAPSLIAAGPEVELLSEVDGRGVAARQGRILVTAFHPELTADLRLHSYFLDLASEV